MVTMLSTRSALKEWAVAVDLLAAGETIALLRKGGIVEYRDAFEIDHERFIFYPNYAHQEPREIDPRWHDAYRASQHHRPPPSVVRISSWARVVRSVILAPTDAAPLRRLAGTELVQSEAGLRDRFDWRPDRPLTLLLVRTYRLEPVDLPIVAAYGGCRSWVELDREFVLDPSRPALDERAFADRVAAVEALFPS